MLPDHWQVLAAGAAALVAAAAAAWFMLRTGFMLSVVDRPNERSLHTRPTPRVGGVALLFGALVGSALLLVTGAVAHFVAALGIGVIGLAVVGAVDDRSGLRARTRLVCQLSAAALAVTLCGAELDGLSRAGVPVVFSSLGLVLVITWYANLYNFMDGSDGLAGSMALFGFGALAAAAGVGQALDLAVLCAALAGGALGFLLFNWHPARMFMGDVGSVPLGFSAALVGIEGTARGLWPLWTPVLAFWPFVFDASLTLIRRLLRGERVWEAHREHLYQKLVRMGWGHARTARVEAAIMLVCGVLALTAARLDWRSGAALTAVVLLGSATCAAWVEIRWKQSLGTPASSSGRDA